MLARSTSDPGDKEKWGGGLLDKANAEAHAMRNERVSPMRHDSHARDAVSVRSMLGRGETDSM